VNILDDPAAALLFRCNYGSHSGPLFVGSKAGTHHRSLWHDVPSLRDVRKTVSTIGDDLYSESCGPEGISILRRSYLSIRALRQLDFESWI